MHLAWYRFIQFSRWKAQPYEKAAGGLPALVCHMWDPYMADRNKIATFLKFLKEQCMFRWDYMALQYRALEMCLTELPGLELLLAAEIELMKLPNRLVQSMTHVSYLGQPSVRWRSFHSFCHHTAKVTARPSKSSIE